MKHFKEIPAEYELAILTALAYFPELEEVKIKFIIRNKTIFPYAARPDWKTMFGEKHNWVYQIIINDHSKKYDQLLLKNLPLKAQIGILSHELSHISWYLNKTKTEIAFTGLRYFWKSFRKKFEQETDKLAIKHGLGQELLEYATYIRSLPQFNKKYGWINQYYLQPNEIIDIMRKKSGAK